MSKKITKNEAIQNSDNIIPINAYVTWDDNDLKDKRDALQEASKGLDEFGLIDKTIANMGRYRTDFSNLDGPTSGRPGLTRRDYDYFRPSESTPTQIKSIFYKADDIYNRVGLVKNVIDLMGDFACQGIRLVHKDKKIERFYRKWFDKIGGSERSERFLNNIYRIGNVIINRQTGKINIKVAEDLYRTSGQADIVVELESKQAKREIPWKYTFIDPLCVDVVGGPLSSFAGKKSYAITLPANLRKIINNTKNEAEQNIIDQLPAAILEAAKSKKPYILDSEKTLVFHYKKDDWKTWAYPMIYSIMDDIHIIEKLKLADLAALDGAISNIRIFKLGSLDHKIAPTPAAANKLSSILQNNVGGGTMDLVWGPDIELLESKTSVHQFLGEGKYTPHLNSIYAGLGIPPTLTGTFGAAGTTNNFISLKTLTQRLQYGRKILIDFWKKEIELVQKAMGFRYPAKIEFDRMDLSNEEAEKALLIQLSDRNIVSDELMQRMFGFDPDTEKNRLNRESREREKNRMVKKAGPWFDPEFVNSLKKISLQTGLASPSEVGLELEDKKPGDKSIYDWKMKIDKSNKKEEATKINTKDSLSGIPGQGRPKNSKDSEKRKTKEFSPQTGAKLLIWANQAQDTINKIVNPIFLDFYNKNNLRKLSASESKELDIFKTKIFFQIKSYEKIDDIYINKLIENLDNNDNIKNSIYLLNSYISNLSSELNRQLTNEEIKNIKSFLYSNINC
jgi:hypothetical protein